MDKMPSKTDLRREKILSFIIQKIKEDGYCPTFREIQTAVGATSVSIVHGDINKLISDGYLKKLEGGARTITLTDKYMSEAEAATKTSNEDLGIVNVNVLGDVAAGRDLLVNESFEDTIPVPAEHIRGEVFALKVKGNSMVDKGILNNDYVIVRKANTANNSDIVVALIDLLDTEVTVKSFYKKDNKIILRPANEMMEDIVFENPNDVKILGIVIGVQRYY